MANAKTKKSGPSWMWRHKLLSLIALLIIAAGAYAAYNHIQTSNNKHDFQQARIAIDSVYNQAVRNIGQPDNGEVKSQCERTHEEFSSGILYCNTGDNFIYAVDNVAVANIVMNKIQGYIRDNGLIPVSPLSKAINTSAVGINLYHTTSDKYRFRSLDCIASYAYDTPQVSSLSIKSNGKAFEISIGCSGKAKQQYYRLAS
jgi:hypothetical protein